MPDQVILWTSPCSTFASSKLLPQDRHVQQFFRHFHLSLSKIQVTGQHLQVDLIEFCIESFHTKDSNFNHQML
jgi:hypothetical protein